MGQSRTRRPLSKKLLVAEGIYSMEREYCNLSQIVKVCTRQYVHLDESHLIGAMGTTYNWTWMLQVYWSESRGCRCLDGDVYQGF